MQTILIRIRKRLSNIPIHFWILGVIVIAGLFLRAYHFHSWLEFNPDQARDAGVVRDALTGKSGFPLLGPIAGGTQFHLGPAFYYFGYVSSLIFGATPDSMAYPTLIFSIFSIPLLYFFLRKYFKTNISLVLSGIYAISYYSVEYSRFAWNPNMIPFFVLIFLYAFLEILNGRDKNSYIWPILAGIGLGIGVQLHTLLLLVMPVVAFILAVYLFWKKRLIWKGFLAIIFVAILLNAPQILSEAKTGGQNIRSFFSGVDKQTGGGGLTLLHAGYAASCQAEANSHLISALENKEECERIFAAGKRDIKRVRDIPGNFQDFNLFVASITLSVIFSIGGYFLLIYRWRKETNPEKRNFLGLLLLFNFIAFLFFWPVASNLFMRYYIILFMIPFVLLGLWIEFVQKKLEKIGVFLSILAVFGLILSNIFVIRQAALPYMNSLASDGENGILGEIEPVSSYIVSTARPSGVAYISGERSYEKRYSESLRYLAAKSNTELSEPEKVSDTNPDAPHFYIAQTSKKKYNPGDEFKGKKIEEICRFGNITIFLLR